MPSTAAQIAYLEMHRCISGSWDNECCSCTLLNMLCYGGFLSYSTPFYGDLRIFPTWSTKCGTLAKTQKDE